MHRTQVSLTDEQIKALRQEAMRRGVSMAEVVRDAVVGHLQHGLQREMSRRALVVAGRFASGRSDVAEEHDRELERAYSDA
jgi:predicted Ser/Thr protein kinase